MVLPDVISAEPSVRVWNPTPVASVGASVRCFPSELWPSPVRQGIGDHETPCSAFNMELYFGAVFIPNVQTRTFANHAVRSHPGAHASRADRGIVARATAGMLPSQTPG